jgi:hypothetical protein
MKLSEDWHIRMNILRRIEDLRDRLELHRGEKKEKECKSHKASSSRTSLWVKEEV